MSKSPSLQKGFRDLSTVLQQWLSAFDNRDRAVAVHQRLKELTEQARNAGEAELVTRLLLIEKPLSALADGPMVASSSAMHTATALKELIAAHMPTPRQSAPETIVLSETLSSETASDPIYVVNRNALVGEDLAVQLRCFGHTVEVLSQIDEIDLAIVRHAPVAMIIDAEYREDVLTKVALLKQQQRVRRSYPIVWISNRGNFKARLSAARAGVDCYFTKPVDIGALTDRLDALIFSKESNPFRILIISDDTHAAQEYKTILNEAKMEAHTLSNPAGIFETLDEYRPELVVMDVNAAECSGIDLTRLIRQNNAYVDVPIVFLSGDESLAHRLEAMHSGADDFIDKPLVATHFVSSLSSRAERYRALRALIMRDSLTGLLNHSAVKETLGREIASSERHHTALSLAMIDIDFFKRVNDTYGHPVGDQVLRTLARLLQQRLRRGDVVGRYGGEEFAIILPGTAAEAARGVLDEIREAFTRIRHHAEDADFTVSFSSGVADVSKYGSVDDLFRAADAALYDAKHKGRNRIEIG
jgi:diguanylate cyclase (GGDEF)-like protein